MLEAMSNSWRSGALCLLAALLLPASKAFAQSAAQAATASSAQARPSAATEQGSQVLTAQEQFTGHAERAQRFLDAHRPQEAIPELEAASAIDPNHVEVEADLGVLLFYRGNVDAALVHLRRALQMRPNLAKIRALVGIAEARSGSAGDAHNDLQAAFASLTEVPIKIDAGLELVSLDVELNREQDAADVLTELQRIAPGDPRVLLACYNTYADLSREAILGLALADPNSAQLQQMLGSELVREGKPEAAIAHYKKALAMNPHLPGGHFDLAEVLGESQDQATRKEAEEEYQLALKDNPGDEKCIRRLGELLSRDGDHIDAAEKFRQALVLAPDDSDAQLDLATSLIEIEEFGEAQRLLEKSAEEEPTDAIVHYQLGRLYNKQGRHADAIKQIDLYKHYKSLKEQLRSTLKELMIAPSADLRDEQPGPDAAGR